MNYACYPVFWGDNCDIFFPKLNDSLHQSTFSDLAGLFLQQQGYEPVLCETEEEARQSMSYLHSQGKWPCYFFTSDTTGEKEEEYFYLSSEKIDMQRFENIGIVKSELSFDPTILTYFLNEFESIKKSDDISRQRLIDLFQDVLPNFHHKETNNFLNQRM